MSFPTVKSDPWEKPNRRRAEWWRWPDSFWKRLCETEIYAFYISKKCLSFEGTKQLWKTRADLNLEAIEMISEMNKELGVDYTTPR